MGTYVCWSSNVIFEWFILAACFYLDMKTIMVGPLWWRSDGYVSFVTVVVLRLCWCGIVYWRGLRAGPLASIQSLGLIWFATCCGLCIILYLLINCFMISIDSYVVVGLGLSGL